MPVKVDRRDGPVTLSRFYCTNVNAHSSLKYFEATPASPDSHHKQPTAIYFAKPQASSFSCAARSVSTTRLA